MGGSSKIQILMILIESLPIKMGVAKTLWVIYTVYTIPVPLQVKKTNFNLRLFPSLSIELESCDIKFEFYLNHPHM